MSFFNLHWVPRMFLFSGLLYVSITNSNCQPLNGSYTVGDVNADYTTLTSVVNDLNSEGIDGPVVINILPGVYNEQVMIFDINGTSSNNTITFQSSTLDSSSVEIYFFITNLNMNYVINVNGADHIKFRHLTIESDGTSGKRGVVIKNGSNSVSFSNNRFISNTTSTYLNNEMFYMYENNNNNLLIENNLFKNGGQAICLGNPGNLNSSQNIQIRDNVFSGAGGGINLYYMRDVLFSGNKKTNSFDIKLDHCTGNTLFKQNEVYFGDPNSEIFFSYVNQNSIGSITVKNNCFDALANFYGSSNISFIHNTVNASRCVSFGNGSNYELLNNVFVSLDNEQSEIISILSNQLTEINSNNNIFYSLDDGYFNIIGVDKYDLDTWQDMTGNDQDSYFDFPTLVSDTNFRSNNSLSLNESAIPIASVNVDIDGDLRDPSTPDLGADEFEIDSATFHNLELISITSPDTLICSEPDSLSISIINHSVFDIDSLVVMWWFYGELQDSSQYIIHIPSSDTANLFLDNLVFNERTVYEVTAQTFLPNGQVDNYYMDNRKSLNYFHLGVIKIRHNEDFYCQQDHELSVNVPSNCSILWSTGEITEKISVTSPGIYSVTVTDPWGCQSSDTITIN